MAQEEACAICGYPQFSEDLSIDHCHETGEVRGLLCKHCNLGLGHFRDDPERLKAAIDYLNQGK